MDKKLIEKIAKCLSPGLLPGQDMFEEEGYFFIKPERRLEIAHLILSLLTPELTLISDEVICLNCCDGDGGRCQRYPKIIRGCDWFERFLKGAQAQLGADMKVIKGE
jgi:hypothetical protein